MSTLTPPQARIPLGFVQIGAQRVDVQPHPEWLRFFAQQLMLRVGGVTSPTITDLAGDISALGVLPTQEQQPVAEDPQFPPSVLPFADDAQEPAAVHLVADDDRATELFALRAEVAALRIEIEALKQGTSQ